MKKIFAILAALVLCSVAVHAKEKEVTYLPEITIKNKTLEKAGREVTLKMDIDMSELRMGTQHTLALTPVLVSKDGKKEYAFPPVVIDGKVRDRIYLRSQVLNSVDEPPMHDENAKVIMRRENRKEQVYSYESATPYERWMLDGHVELRETVHGCVNCPKGESALPFLAGILPTFYPSYTLGTLEPEPEPIKVREESRTARINFKRDRYEILRDYKGNRAELDTVINSVLLVKNNADVTITGIYIDGYASPEGTIKHNITLSKNRANSLADYIRKNAKVDEKLFNVAWHGEDWDGFKKMMLEDNRLPGLHRRDEVVAILAECTEDSDACQKKIEALTPRKDVYIVILDNLYPELRRNEYRIVYDVRNFDLEEAKVMIHKRPDLLSLKEMYMVAGSYEKGSKEYEKAMDIAAKHYPNSPAVLNDKVLDLMAEEEYQEVVDLLEKSKLTDDNAVLLNALGTAYAYVGDPYKAEEILKLAVAEGSTDAQKNLEQVQKVIDQL